MKKESLTMMILGKEVELKKNAGKDMKRRYEDYVW